MSSITPGAESSTPSAYRPIRPAKPGERPPSEPPGTKKRKITAVACQACQKKRCKCDGKRPQCSACEVAGRPEPCVYETRGNQSRSEALKERNTELEREVQRLRDIITSASSSTAGPSALSPAAQKSTEDVDSPGQNTPSHSGASTTNINRDDKRESQRYSGITSLEDRLGPYKQHLSSSTSERPPQAISSAKGDVSAEEEFSTGKVMFLEAEVQRLREALAQLQTHGEATSASKGKMALRPSASATNHPTQRPLHAQTQISGNAGSMLDASGATINPMDTQQFVQHGMSDIGITEEALAAPDADLELGNMAAVTPYGVLPQPLGNAAHPATIPPSMWQSSTSPASYAYRPGQQQSHIEVFGNLSTTFGNLPLSSAILSNHQQPTVQQSQVNNLRLPLHLIQMLNWDENGNQTYDYTSPEFGSSTLHSFRAFDRNLIASGQNPDDVLGGPDIDIRPFFLKGEYDVYKHTPSTFGPWFVEAYPSMELPTRVAAAVMVTTLLRWQIYPTIENYEAIPVWFRATGAQMFVPHMSAFDYVPWPEIRNLLIATDARNPPSREILVWVLSHLHVDWPYGNDQMFLWDETGNATTVSPRFVQHIHDLNNWALNVDVLRRYPMLQGKARFVDMSSRG